MADFGSTKRDATLTEWQEQLISMLEINGYNPDFCDIAEDSVAHSAYERGVAVSDFFYDNYEDDE